MCKILPIATWPNVNSLVGFINHKTKSQTVCKPGSVPRILRGGSHSSGMIVANHLTRHTRGAGQRQPMRAPYLVLLQAGFALPAMLPPPRCALTAPFHPYLTSEAVCFLWHFPSACAGRALPAATSLWSPDFPPMAGYPTNSDCPTV